MICFHYSYYIMAIGYVLCGYYINLIAITSLVIVHELGHYLVCKLLKFRVSKIVIYPFGGITKINDLINKDINCELLVVCSGVIFQFMFYLIVLFLNNKGFVRDYTMNVFSIYNSQIIFFNLLPIYPLDGSKIFNLLFSKVLSYKLANKLTVFLSCICMVFYVFFNNYCHNYSYFMILGVLIIYNYKFFRGLKYIYNKFLLERYLYNIKYDKIKLIDNHNKMYKNRSHIFLVNGKCVSEKKYLPKYYFN